MRKLPQDLAFPLGLGSKGSKDDNKSKSGGQKSFDNDDKDKDQGGQNGNKEQQPTVPVQDLDTINL